MGDKFPRIWAVLEDFQPTSQFLACFKCIHYPVLTVLRQNFVMGVCTLHLKMTATVRNITLNIPRGTRYAEITFSCTKHIWNLAMQIFEITKKSAPTLRCVVWFLPRCTCPKPRDIWSTLHIKSSKSIWNFAQCGFISVIIKIYHCHASKSQHGERSADTGSCTYWGCAFYEIVVWRTIVISEEK